MGQPALLVRASNIGPHYGSFAAPLCARTRAGERYVPRPLKTQTAQCIISSRDARSQPIFVLRTEEETCGGLWER